jgi:hypothetical protein
VAEIRARPEPIILLSSEEFSLLNRSQVQAVAAFLDDFDVVPLLYFRRYDEYMQAMYCTAVLASEEKTSWIMLGSPLSGEGHFQTHSYPDHSTGRRFAASPSCAIFWVRSASTLTHLRSECSLG